MTKSFFNKPLTLTKLKNDDWKVAEGFSFFYKGTEEIKVPKGFETDLASVPPVANWLIPKDGTYSQAAVLHDYLYGKQLFKRSKCDAIFLEAMKVLKVFGPRRYAMWSAVRSFGWIAWKRKG